MARMRTNVPIAMRALRTQRRWRQQDLGRRAGLSRDAVCRAERGRLDSLTVRSLTRLVAALDATLVLEIRWQGADLDRLLDRVHAQLQDAVARRLLSAAWTVRPEVSFNHYGDRGRCDLVAWHPETRTMLIVEVKSRFGDLQETLGRLDVKIRTGGVIARQLQWPRPEQVVAALVLAEDRTTRRVVSRHEALFRGFDVRGRTALRYLRAPEGRPDGLLWFEPLPDSDHGRMRGGHRVQLGRDAG